MMKLGCTVLCFLLLISIAQAPLWGQSKFDQLPALQRKLLAIKVTGTKRYSENDVIAASGLQLGATVVEDDFKKAARHLADTGAFTDIAYTYSYSSQGAKLQLSLIHI